MAAVSRSRRSLAGIVFIVAGALLLLAILLPYLSVSLPWLTSLGFVALAVGLFILGLWAVNSTLAKVLLIVSAVAWLLYALIGFGLPLASLTTLVALIAGIGALLAAVVMYVGREFTNVSAAVFIIATALGLLAVLIALGIIGGGATVAVLVSVLFALALIASGYLFSRKERGRR